MNKFYKFNVTAIIGILILVAPIYSQVSKKNTESEITTGSSYNCQAMKEFLLDTFVKASKSGGLIITKNSCPENLVFSESEREELSLDEKLDLIVQRNPTYRWSDEQGIINLTPDKCFPKLLNVEISNFKIADVNNLNAVMDKILQLPEVKGKLKELNLRQGMQFGGIMSPPSNRPPTEMEFKDKTLQQILNEIVRKRGRGVWVYSESEFNGENTFSLGFLVN